MAHAQLQRKKRELPPWMTAQGAGTKSVPAWSPSKRLKPASSSLPPIRTVYLMNEAELVDVALGILVEFRKQEKPLEHTLLLGTDEIQTTPPESPWTSDSISDGEEEGNDAPGTSPSDKQVYSASGHKNSEDEEDEDALKYVREIFFS